jgi:DEAD/DEAH box helicase domain-containing protein
MNPILLGRQVTQGLKDLVRDTLNTTSSVFDGIIERFLAEPHNYIKGPWISVSMPFRQSIRPGEPFKQPFPEVPLKFAPYRHQELAFERLSGLNPRSTLVATGTGSGKTESYLWPILEHCRVNRGKPGIKAILIYPMNALATDQARRIARAIHTIPSLHGVRAGIYADSEPRHATDNMTPEDVITRRSAMWDNPPDILLTNYKMLDYLLLRARDKRLWDQNGPETLRFLVVDEMHTFDGAQGADLALLLRRVKHRLKTPADHLLCVGSSATLGSGEEAAAELRAYAERIFGETFDEEAVIREDRKTPDEVLPSPEYFDWPAPGAVEAALAAAVGQSQAGAAKRLSQVLFPDESDQETAFLHRDDPSESEWRLMLGKLLLEHVAAQRVIRIIASASGPASLDDIAEELAKVKALVGRSPGDRARLAELVVSLLAWARSGRPPNPQPLFGIRIQIWAREMARMVTTMPEWRGADSRASLELFHAGDLDRYALKQVLPIVNCSRCGTAAHLARHAASGKSIWASLDDLYEGFFDDSSDRIRLIYHEPVSRRAGTTGTNAIIAGFLDGGSMEFTPGDHGDELEPGPIVPAWLYNPTDRNGRLDRTCPACGHANGLLLFGLRAARMTAALANTLYNSEQNEEEPGAKPRLLLFSDSVQDAAQRAAVAEIRNSGAVIRKALYRAVVSSDTRGLSLAEVIDELPETLEARIGAEAFVSTFISKQQTWRDPFQKLLSTGALPLDAQFLRHIRLRLGWEFFSDLTYRSHTSQTLEVAGLVVADVDPDRLRQVASRLVTSLPLNVGNDFVLEEEPISRFLAGLLQQMRRRGAVGHEYVVAGMSADPPRAGGVNYFAASRSLGLGKTGTLPIPDPRRGAAPLPVTLSYRNQGYETLNRDHPTNWYRDWIGKFFLPVSLLAPSRYDDLFAEVMSKLEAEAILSKVSRDNGDHGYVIEPEAITVSDDILHLCCDRCQRAEVVLVGSPLAEGSPCTRIACLGSLRPVAARSARHVESLLQSDRLHRVVGYEHTGLLQSDARRALENAFINDNHPWSPNLISATPTLEMGIDIGDLSTLLLCSVPPEEANYVQRIGRTGRRDGNSLNVTFANARAHDMQFWEEPNGMLAGRLRAPGVYLEAIAVLRRQMAAFTLDCFVASGRDQHDYGKVRAVLKGLENEVPASFPIDWFEFVAKNGPELVKAFLALLPANIAAKEEIRTAVEDYLLTKGDKSLVWRVRSAFDAAAAERRHLLDLRSQLDAEAQRLVRNKHTLTPEELGKRLNEIQGEKGEVNQAIRKGIDEVYVLQFLTDRGILPNYAFPEEGVKLKSILVRQSENGQRRDDGEDLTTLEYMRPASSALTEFAPGQSFYANGREVRIDRIDLNQRDRSTWHFCQRCSHAEQEAMASTSIACPKCGDEMWGDTGSKHTVIELRSVLAVTQEQKAAIQDTDDRTQRQHDRAIIPFYKEEAIGVSWLANTENNSTPFGFEFISPCEFRDFNFGEKAAAPVGPRIAGEDRQAYAFPICGHCGRLQGRKRNEEDQGEHQPRCSVLRTSTPLAREAWEDKVFLMRKFSTETIRIVVPVIGEADHDEIKSFIAAINLGMRKHFSGKVDHIRSAVVETHLDEMVTIRSLYLYDAVPGGSGYLRQLAEHPHTMKSVITKAAEALQTCACVEEGKSGCFRCVKSYRSQFGPGEPDRDTALQMMQAILAQWENLSQTTRGINVSIKDYLVDSQLERRFMEVLHNRFGPASLTAQVLEGGRKGFLLNTVPDGKGRLWTIETQVQVDKRFQGLPKKRVDFLLTPIGSAGEKPIVVEMDGLSYHSKTVDQDLIDRMIMIRSGKVRVWTLGWQDLEDGGTTTVPNPLSSKSLGNQHQGLLGRALSQPNMAPHAAAVKLLAEAPSLEVLFEALSGPTFNLSDPASVLLRLVIGKGRDLSSLPRIGLLSTDGSTFLKAGAIHGHCGAGPLDCYLSADALPPQDWHTGAGGLRVLLRTELSRNDPSGQSLPLYGEAWRGLWRLVNVLQDLRGFHVEFPGMDTLSAPVMGSCATASQEQAWEAVLSLADAAFEPLLIALTAADVAAPDAIGLDLMADGVVIGMAEVAWSHIRLAICDQPLAPPGWRVIHFDPFNPDYMPQIPVLVRQIIGIVEGTQP